MTCEEKNRARGLPLSYGQNQRVSKGRSEGVCSYLHVYLLKGKFLKETNFKSQVTESLNLLFKYELA